MASPDWYSVKIPVQGIDTDILAAWLDMSEVDAIIEGELYFEAFVSEDNLEGLLEMMSEKYSFTKEQLDVTKQEDKNWNQLWESSFDPVIIDDIMIRANFHPPPPKEMTDILIQPKMAFGTGHHETTFQMMEKLNSMDISGAKVLDYGCGTGILSVMALKKPIIHLDAIDIQEEAVENTLENFELNQLDPCKYWVGKGDLELVAGKSYDLVLANINRHILESKADAIVRLVNTNGDLLLSGILFSDYDLITSIYQQKSLNLFDESQKGEWLCLHFKNS